MGNLDRMRVLVTGAKGFVGQNLCARLRYVRGVRVMEYDADSEIDTEAGIDERYGLKVLDGMCREADFVFHLAGVNRPEDPEDFMRVNAGLTASLLEALRRHSNRCPVILASSVQAALTGRYAGSPYGESKLAAEKLVFDHARLTGARVLVYRFPNVFGKWCRPEYNSAVATFCHNIARGLPVRVDDPDRVLELLYIDDLVEEMLLALQGREHRCRYEGAQRIADPQGRFCGVPQTFHVSLGETVRLLREFAALPHSLTVPKAGADGFGRRLLSAFLSYLPPQMAVCDLRMNTDDRGSFTELLHAGAYGQVSVNVSRPGVSKGEHWHCSKWERFVVVKGHGLIRMRRVGSPEVTEFDVCGERMQAVTILPGFTHSIVNLSETEDMVTVMYCNEVYDPERPDTFSEPVCPQTTNPSSRR